MQLINSLRELGFGDYEARAYVALVQHGALNGYALAKASGVPRANIYAVADKLIDRGAAQRVDFNDGTSFKATPPADLLQVIQRRQQQALDTAQDALAQLDHAIETALVVNLRDGELLANAKKIIDATQHTLLIAIQPVEAAQLAVHLRQARERGVNITTLCLQSCEHECGGCQGEIHRYQLAPNNDKRWLLLVSDQDQVLVGQLELSSAEGILSNQPLVVELTAAYIRQSLTLALLGSEVSARFDGLLSVEAKQLLDRMYPGHSFVDWIQSLAAKSRPSSAAPPAHKESLS